MQIKHSRVVVYSVDSSPILPHEKTGTKQYAIHERLTGEHSFHRPEESGPGEAALVSNGSLDLRELLDNIWRVLGEVTQFGEILECDGITIAGDKPTRGLH